MDHNSLIVKIPLVIVPIKKSFQIFNFMMEYEGFKDAVIDAWCVLLSMVILWPY